MDGFIKGKIVFKRTSGLYGIKTEDKKIYIAYEQETNAKIKQGKTVLFQPGGQDVFVDGALAKRRHALNVRNNTLPAEMTDEKLREAVKAYYEFRGNRKVRLYNVVTCFKTGRRMLLVHFVNVDDERKSSLMLYGDDYSLIEVVCVPREEEINMVIAINKEVGDE